MSDDKSFCPIRGTLVSTVYSVHLPMDDDSTGYLHGLCWLSMFHATNAPGH